MPSWPLLLLWISCQRSGAATDRPSATTRRDGAELGHCALGAAAADAAAADTDALALLQGLAGARRAAAGSIGVGKHHGGDNRTSAEKAADPNPVTQPSNSTSSASPAARSEWLFTARQDLNLSVSKLLDELPMHGIISMLWQASPSSVEHASGTAAVAAPERKVDITVIMIGVFILAVFYGLVLLCLTYEKQHEDAARQEKYMPPTAKLWPPAPFEVRAEVPPALSVKMLFSNRDLPLLMPLKRFRLRNLFGSLYSRPIHVSGSSGRKRFVLHPREVEQNVREHRAIEVREVEASGEQGELVAAINSELEIIGSHSTTFGKLFNDKGFEFLLQEAHGGTPRWVVTAVPNANTGVPDFNVTMRPHNRLLATASVRCDHRSDYLEVMTTQGVDCILVLTCVVGLISFTFSPQSTTKTALLEDLTGELEASAARLLQQMQ